MPAIKIFKPARKGSTVITLTKDFTVPDRVIDVLKTDPGVTNLDTPAHHRLSCGPLPEDKGLEVLAVEFPSDLAPYVRIVTIDVDDLGEWEAKHRAAGWGAR